MHSSVCVCSCIRDVCGLVNAGGQSTDGNGVQHIAGGINAGRMRMLNKYLNAQNTHTYTHGRASWLEYRRDVRLNIFISLHAFYVEASVRSSLANTNTHTHTVRVCEH